MTTLEKHLLKIVQNKNTTKGQKKSALKKLAEIQAKKLG